MASPFWTYFHDKLNWRPIFRPGPLSAIMKGLALHMDDVRADILWLREQWNPETCEMELIEKYGISRGIPRSRFDTDDSYRNRVIHAYAWHKLAGKIHGLERIFSENGFDAKVSNLSDPDLWAHFRVDIDANNKNFDASAIQLAWYLANEYKPARSILEKLSTKSEISLQVHRVAGIITQATSTRQALFFFPAKDPELWQRAHPAVISHTSEMQVLRIPEVVAPILQIRVDPAVSTFTLAKQRIFFPSPMPLFTRGYSFGQRSWTRSRVCLGQ